MPNVSSKYSESVLVTLEGGTLARIDDVLERFEDRSAYAARSDRTRD